MNLSSDYLAGIPTVDCPECGLPMVCTGEGQTLVGYISPPGHDHNDNCLGRVYECSEGHTVRLSKRRTCPACDWKGKLTCFCHKGDKLDEWPEAGDED